MRILGGIRKGQSIHPPKGLPVRPTTDRSRESLMNILSNLIDIEGLDVLDLFSGTGIMSIEWASRQAKTVVSVDRDRGCTQFLKKMSAEWDLPQIQIIQSDVLKFLSRNTQKFDVIFADPPYDWNGINQMVKQIIELQFLQNGGIFILEHASYIEPGFLHHRFDYRKYGQSAFSFYRGVGSQA